MSKDFYIMCKDIEVMRVNFDEIVYDVIDCLHLPWGLKGRIEQLPEAKESYSRYELIQIQRISQNNYEAIISWLANRVLTLSRANAKCIYNMIGADQTQTDRNKAQIALVCRAVSLQDAYWVKLQDDNITWDQVDIHKNRLNEVITQVALHGKSLTLQGSLQSPEFTTDGTYAKAWRRHKDGNVWLYKKGVNGNTESRIEVMCSNLLDKMNVSHVHYEAGEDEGAYVCMCPCITTSELSILTGLDFYSYCNRNGLDFEKEYLRIDADSMYKMWIVDYLIANRDRHSLNWGFFYNQDSMKILGCHPLFDHNNAFDTEFMQNREAPYQFGDMTIRQAAKLGMLNTDFHFTADITRDDFITDRQYTEFMWRAKDLGIKTI